MECSLALSRRPAADVRARPPLMLVALALVGPLLCVLAPPALGADVVAYWVNGDGYWTDPAHWTTADYPHNDGLTYDALIDIVGSPYAVTLDTDVTIDNLLLNSGDATLWHISGTLSVPGSLDIQAGTYSLASEATLAGGMVNVSDGAQFLASGELDGITLAGQMTLPSGSYVIVRNGLTLADAKVLLVEGSSSTDLRFSGTQTLGGIGEVVFDGYHYVAAARGGTLTVAPGVTIRTGEDGGVVGANGAGLVNQGTISAQGEGRHISIYGDNWVNTGLLEARNGGILFLGGTFTTTGLGDVRGEDGSIRIRGSVDNTGQELAVNATTGSVILMEATLRGGTISTSDGRRLVVGHNYDGTLDGVTLAGDVELEGATLYVHNGLTLTNGTITIPASTSTWDGLLFDGDQTFDGTGQVLFRGGGYPGLSRVFTINGGLTIGPGITVRTDGAPGEVGHIAAPLLNQGLLSAQTQDVALTVTGAPFTNEGILEVTNGSTLTVDGVWANHGTFRVVDGTLNLAGEFSSADLGTFDRQGGTINIKGTVANAGRTLALNASTGSVCLGRDGVVLGGTVTASDGAQFLADSSVSGEDPPVLEGVNLDTDLYVGHALFIRNGLTLTAGHQITRSGDGRRFQLYFEGTQVLDGAGEVVFDGDGECRIRVPDSGVLTLGPGITIRTGGRGGSFQGGWDDVLVNQGTISCETPQEISILCDWTNAGTLRISDGRLNLGGRFATADIGAIERTGGEIRIIGTLDNTGATLALDAATGAWSLDDNGAIVGGMVTASEGTKLLVGGECTLDGVTLDTDLETNWEGDVTVRNGLTLARDVFNMDGDQSIILRFEGDQSLNTNTEIVFGGDAGSQGHFSLIAQEGELTIGPDVTIRTGSCSGGVTERSGARVVNRGRIISDNPGLYINVYGTNEGTIEASNGGVVYLRDFLNRGTASVSSGQMNLSWPWTNEGTISATDSLVYMAYASLIGDFSITGGKLRVTAAFTTADINGINCNSTVISVYNNSIVDNSGDVIHLDPATRMWELSGGTISGGLITGAPGTELVVPEESSGTLVDVTLNVPLTAQDGAGSLSATNLTNNSTITFNGKVLTLNGTWANNGSITANGAIVKLYGPTTEVGSFTIDEADLRIGASYTSAQLMAFQGVPDHVTLEEGSEILNTGDVLTMRSSYGMWWLSGGTITGGTVSSSDSTALETFGTHGISGTLDGVTLEADLGLDYRGWVVVRNGLTLSGAQVRMTATSPYLDPTLLEFDGTQTLGGTGEVVFDTNSPSNLKNWIRPLNGTLTIGPGVTIRTAAVGGTIGDAAWGLVNQGTISARTAGAIITVTGNGLINQGTFEAVNGGQIVVSPTGPFQNDGLLSVGKASTFEIDGDLIELGPEAYLVLELGGLLPDEEFARLLVAGDATLAGTLEIALVDGFVPELGDEFPILNCLQRYGTFANVVGWHLGGGRNFSVLYRPDGVTLVTVPEPAALGLLLTGCLLALGRRRARR